MSWDYAHIKFKKAGPLGEHSWVGRGNPEIGRDDVRPEFSSLGGVGGKRANRVLSLFRDDLGLQPVHLVLRTIPH